MKANQQLRQNQKVVQHGIRKFQIPEPRRRAAKVLGRHLPGLRAVRPILKDIRKEFMTGVDEEGNEYELEQEEIDWKAIRAELEVRLRAIPEILPPEIDRYRKIVDDKAKLDRKLILGELTRQALRNYLRVVFKAFRRCYVLIADNLALPMMKAADRFFAGAADNLLEFLKTGVEQELPNDWITAVHTMDMFGDKVIVAMANELANPDETAEQFCEEFARQFGKRKNIFTKTDVYVAKYVRMHLEDVARRDIGDQYMQDNYPELEPGSGGYRSKKKDVEDMLDKSIGREQERLDKLLSDKT